MSQTNYKQLFADAKKRNNVVQLEVEKIDWDVPGKTVIGRLVSYTRKGSKTTDGSYNSYIIETDTGMKKCICGVGVDEVLGSDNFIGTLVCLEYKGQKQLGGTKKMNEFLVSVVEVDGS